MPFSFFRPLIILQRKVRETENKDEEWLARKVRSQTAAKGLLSCVRCHHRTAALLTQNTVTLLQWLTLWGSVRLLPGHFLLCVKFTGTGSRSFRQFLEQTLLNSLDEPSQEELLLTCHNRYVTFMTGSKHKETPRQVRPEVELCLPRYSYTNVPRQSHQTVGRVFTAHLGAIWDVHLVV